MNLNDRQYFINMHSIIHNPLSPPKFKNLIKSSFAEVKMLDETIGEINKPNDVCLEFRDLSCCFNHCEEQTLLVCLLTHLLEYKYLYFMAKMQNKVENIGG